MATDVSSWFIIEPWSHYHLIRDLYQNCRSGLHQNPSYNRSGSRLMTYWDIFTSYCSSTHTNIPTEADSWPDAVNSTSSGWRSAFMRRAWLPSWGASGIAMEVWGRTTTPWSSWGRTMSAWEPSASRAGGCLRIACSLVPHRLWDSTSSARDPPRPPESAGWGPRWEREGGQSPFSKDVILLSVLMFESYTNGATKHVQTILSEQNISDSPVNIGICWNKYWTCLATQI